MPNIHTDLSELIGSEHLKEWMAQQRWYASKGKSITSLSVIDQIDLSDDLQLRLLLAQVRFAQGTHEIYQLPLTNAATDGAAPLGSPTATPLPWRDALTDPATGRELMARIDAHDEIETEQGRVRFQPAKDAVPIVAGASVRRISGEQSNSSLIIDERVVLKVFRRLEPGINPELEMVRFLRRHGFRAVPALHGWYEYEGPALAGTLGVASEMIADGVDGWELALQELIEAPEQFVARAAELGTVTGLMHNALASDPADPAFSPEEPSHESLTLLTAKIDDEIERLFRTLPDDPQFDSIRGRGDEIRALLALYPVSGNAGTLIRIHGDYHLGQTLYTPRGWVLLDFEGEPARPLTQRRQKRSPLRDVASMLRSFDYAVFAEPLLRGRPAPEGTAESVRDGFLTAYLETIDAALLPTGRATIDNVLAIHELEKAVYELRYEIDNRPDWVTIPATGIVRLLESA